MSTESLEPADDLQRAADESLLRCLRAGGIASRADVRDLLRMIAAPLDLDAIRADRDLWRRRCLSVQEERNDALAALTAERERIRTLSEDVLYGRRLGTSITIAALAGEGATEQHFHGCPAPTGRPFDCDYCQERAASMGGVE